MLQKHVDRHRYTRERLKAGVYQWIPNLSADRRLLSKRFQIQTLPCAFKRSRALIIVADHRHVVEHMKAVISSLQLSFCTLTNAFIITNSANTM